jgi:hypothetical protein
MLSNGIQTIILDDSIMRIVILIRKTLKKTKFYYEHKQIDFT